jgi:hypothetical protein
VRSTRHPVVPAFEPCQFFGSSGEFRTTDKVQGGTMLRLLSASIIFLIFGCSSITQRFDAMAERIGDTNEQIRLMNSKLDETNRHLTQIEQSLKRLAGNAPEAEGAQPAPRP